MTALQKTNITLCPAKAVVHARQEVAQNPPDNQNSKIRETHTQKFQVIPLQTRKLRDKWAKPTCIRSHFKMSQLLPLGSYEKKCNRSFATLESFFM